MPEQQTSRHLAVICLLRWDRERQAVQPYIETLVHASPLSAADRQLATMLIQGVLRHMQELDEVLVRFAKHPLQKMKPLTLMALRVGAYQLLFLDRIPDRAAVDEMVKVLKAERQPRWIINFVNGVLRTIGREKDSLPGPDESGENRSAVLNHPQWLVQRWQKKYGQQKTEEICRVNNREPALSLRVNSRLSEPEALINMFAAAGIKAERDRYAPNSVVLADPAGPVTGLPGYDKGFFHVQDGSAQLATLLLGPFDRGKSYLDACAGLGGKTCQLAQLIPDDSQLVALEPNKHRFQLLRENLQRLGLDGRVVYIQDAIENMAQAEKRRFDGILVDAPCSGTGVIRRHPEIRWNRKPEDLPSYQKQQLAILEHAAVLLQPGGILVYATCSMEPEENEELVEIFLHRNNAFALADASDYLPPAARGLVSSQGFFAPTPADGVDGFFGARLQKAR